MSVYTEYYEPEAAARMAGEEFMPVTVGDDEVYWIIPDADGIPWKMIGEVQCVYGGTIDVAECGHAVCDGQNCGEDCLLPRAETYCAYPGTLESPPEYEAACDSCIERMYPSEPDEPDDDPYYDRDCADEWPYV